MLLYDLDALARIQGFALTFFNYQLKGEDEFAQYLTREFVEEVAPLGERVTFDALEWSAPTP